LSKIKDLVVRFFGSKELRKTRETLQDSLELFEKS